MQQMAWQGQQRMIQLMHVLLPLRTQVHPTQVHLASHAANGLAGNAADDWLMRVYPD